jgi:DNA-binding protein H-NS
MHIDHMSKTDDKTDITGLSYAELRDLLRRTEALIADKRVEELKVLADGYAKKLQMAGFGIQEGMDALRPYLPLVPERKAAASGEPRKAKYANPVNPAQTWVGVGKPPDWFKQQLAAGRSRDDLLAG